MYKVLRTMSGINECSMKVNQCPCAVESLRELLNPFLVSAGTYSNYLTHFVLSALRKEGCFVVVFK